MSKYGSDDLTITVDGNDMSNYIDEMDELMIEALLEESTAFGDSWEEHLWTGIRRAGGFKVSGFYDDTAGTGPDAIFGTAQLGTSVTTVITWGGTKTSSMTTFFQTYGRKPVRKSLTRFSATLMPSGAVTEA